MKKKNSIFTSANLFPTALLIFCSVILSNCKDKKLAAGNGAGGDSAQTFSMKSIILDSLTLKAWVDSNWTKPNGIRLMIMQFVSSNAAEQNSNMVCIAYPAKKLAAAGAMGSVFLKTDPGSAAVTFTDSVIIANNCFDFTKDNLFNNDGSLNGFTYLKFTPKKNSGNFITFEVAKYNKQGLVAASYPTNPCPPCQYCPDGCPAEAIEE